MTELSVDFVQLKGLLGGKAARFDAVQGMSFKVATCQTLALFAELAQLSTGAGCLCAGAYP